MRIGCWWTSGVSLVQRGGTIWLWVWNLLSKYRFRIRMTISMMIIPGNFCQVLWADTSKLGVGCARSPKTGKVLLPSINIIISLSPAKSDKTPFRWLWWRSTILPGTWEIIWTICLHQWIIPLADIEVQWLNAEMIKQWECINSFLNHSTQSQSGMREATHPVPLIRERIVLLNFVKTKYSHRLTFDIGPWFLACASVSGRILSQHYYFASFLSSYGPICPEIISYIDQTQILRWYVSWRNKKRFSLKSC